LNARKNINVFSLDVNVPSESLSATVLGREFHVAGAEQQNACLALLYWQMVRTISILGGRLGIVSQNYVH